MDNNGFSKRLTASLIDRHETDQWTTLIGRLLRRLELKPEDREKAEKGIRSVGGPHCAQAWLAASRCAHLPTGFDAHADHNLAAVANEV